MHAEDLNAVHRQAADTAGLIQRLADRVHGIGEATGDHRSEFENLIAAVDELAARAWSVAESIDGCLALGCRRADPDAGDAWAIAGNGIALELIMLLGRILNAAVAVYRLACGELADRLSLAEEHLRSPAQNAAQRLTSTVLVQHTRALEANTVARARP
jgi:hypothetical protein